MKSAERKFLHDLSNGIAISYGNIKILSAKLAKDPDEVDKAYLISRIDKALDAFEKINQLIVGRRQALVAEESNPDPDSAAS